MTTIAVGDKIPSVRIKVAGPKGGGEELTTDELLQKKRVVLFGLPGAFTPTCSAKHLPGFLENAARLRDRGVDLVACSSVNDAWVMGAWGVATGAFPELTLIADGNGDLTELMGLTVDLRQSYLGLRSRRFAMIVDDRVVRHVGIDEPGKLEVSSAEAILGALDELRG
jgi:glutaredoxin/glutathione-dependent peroxiredoxin